MSSPEAHSATVRSPGQVGAVAVGAVVSMVGFRVGILRGGLVGVDLGLALLGWWAAGRLGSEDRPAEVIGAIWRRAWPALLVAVGLAVVWALTTAATRYDAVVRGQALGLAGGYGNWHLLALGPPEELATRNVTPLQSLWPWSVVLQSLAVLLVLHLASRPMARQRPEARDPLAVAAAVAGAVALAVALAMLAAGASGQALLLATPGCAAALLLGAAVGASGPTSLSSSIRAIAFGLRWFAAVGLAALALVAEPGDGIGSVAPLVAPVLAAVLVAGTVPWPPGRRSRAAAPDIDPWTALVAVAVLHGPAIALLAGPGSSVPPAIGALVGVAIALVLAALVALACGRLSWERLAIDRRRVLLPPLAVLLVVVLFSATGAFHWAGPTPRSGSSIGGP